MPENGSNSTGEREELIGKQATDIYEGLVHALEENDLDIKPLTYID